MKAMTTAITAHGFLALFTTWQTYAMIAAGGLAMFLLQSALNAGTLLAANPASPPPTRWCRSCGVSWASGKTSAVGCSCWMPRSRRR